MRVSLESNDYQAVPAGLRERDQWVVWRYQQRDGSRPAKVPFNPREPNRKASVNDPLSWGTFEEALTAVNNDRRRSDEEGGVAAIAGLGFVVTAYDPLCGYDLDDCVVDGEVHPAAAEILDQIQAYKELSPSGTGMRAIFIATHEGRHRTRSTPWGGDFECYDRARVFTITGEGGGVPEPQQDQHDRIVARLLPPKPTTQTQAVGGGKRGRPAQEKDRARNGHSVDHDDEELLERMFAARNGPKVRALWDGDISAYQDDDSAADLALCSCLAFWTGGDAGRIDSLFRGSGLMRDKWDSPRGDGTYGEQTVEKAVKSCPRFYSPAGSRKRTNGATSSPFGEQRPAIPTDLYRETPHGLVWNKRTERGEVKVWLANFTARIVTDTLVDYGSCETTRIFTIQVRVSNGQKRELDVPAGSFPGMKWVANLGASAWLEPGPGLCDRARHAIQQLSEPIDRRVYAHTGWTRLNGQDIYLHAGGGIGPHGPVPDIEVRLPEQLALLVLPAADGSKLKKCVRASLELLELGPVDAMAPLLCSAYRAPLGTADMSTHANGPTGTFKTEVGALCQQHFGAGFDSRHLPGSWSSTANFNSDLLWRGKDALVVIDDFAPTGSKHDVQKQHREAERVMRGQGNHAGRGRMNANGTLRASRPPRGLLLSTGEDVPGQQSLRARIEVVDIHVGAIDQVKLTAAQAKAGNAVFATAMAGYLQWIATLGVDRIQRHVSRRARKLRESVATGEHQRSAANLAELACGLEIFLEFAAETGAITSDNAGELWELCWIALMRTAAIQSQHQRETDPARVFLSHLAGAITSGLAYLDGVAGGPPGQNPRRLGVARGPSSPNRIGEG
jgi:hypothetical protein